MSLDDSFVAAVSLVISSAAILMPLLAAALAIFMQSSPLFLSYYFASPLCDLKDVNDLLIAHLLLILDWLMATADCEVALYGIAGVCETLMTAYLIFKCLR